MDNPGQIKPIKLENIRETIESLNSFHKRLSETRRSISSPKSGPSGDLQHLAENGGRRSETHDDGSETGIASPKSISGKEDSCHREEANENVGVEPVIPNEEVAQSRSGAIDDSNNGSHVGSLALPNNNNGGNDGNTDNPALGGEESTNTVCSFIKKLKKMKKKQENRNASSKPAGSRKGAEIGRESNENLQIDQMSRNLKELVKSLEGLTTFEEQLNFSIQNLQPQLERFLQRLKSGPIDSYSAKEISKEIKKLKNQIPLSRGLISADSNLHPSRHPKKVLITCLPNLPGKEKITDSKAYKEIEKIYAGFDKQHQQCFLCFAVFPENEVVKRRLLTYWWLGENFIDSETPEKAAKKILEDFQAKGLIEPVITKKNREYRRFRMPPLVRSAAIDLAQKAGFFDYDSDGNPTANLTKCNRACLVNRKARLDSDLETKPENLVNGKARLDRDLETKPENLDAIFNVSDPFPDLALEELSKNKKTIENNISVVEWVMKMKKLKVLFLGRWQSSAIHHIEVESTEFLQALEKMRELRFLSLQGISWINEIPRSIKSARQMRILDLKACHNLEVLPKEIRSLKKLTHLDISDCFLLDHLPRALSSLSELQVLKGFVICSEKMRNSCSLPDLVALKKLRKLSIVSNRRDFPNAKELDALRTLGRSGALRKLTISWGWRLEQTVQPTTAKSKLKRQLSRMRSKKENMENPGSLPEELEKLDLQCFPEESPPYWLMSTNVKNMTKLYIRGGRLSSLGEKTWETVEILKLKYLREFKSDWMKLREKFPKLIYLEKTNCPWVSFCPTDEHGVWQKAEEEGGELHANAASSMAA